MALNVKPEDLLRMLLPLRASLSKAGDVLREMEVEEEAEMNTMAHHGPPPSPEPEDHFEAELAADVARERQEHFKHLLNTSFGELTAVLEAAGLERQIADLESEWKLAGPVGKTHYNHQYEYLESSHLDLLYQFRQRLEIVAGGGPTPAQEFELQLLERLLRSTNVLVHQRAPNPTREQDVQSVMNDYLKACFPEYMTGFELPRPLVRFRPDGGVANLKAAIEFKFAGSAAEVSTAFHGIAEDIAGYSGSNDWVRFYSVVYQTAAFVSEGTFQAAVRSVGGHSWTPIVVTGSGARVPRPRSS